MSTDTLGWLHICVDLVKPTLYQVRFWIWFF